MEFGLYAPVMSWDPDPTIAVPVPVSSYPDDGIWWRSRTVFYTRWWSWIRPTLNHNGRRGWGWLSVNDCLCAAAESQQGQKRHRESCRGVERKFHGFKTCLFS